MANTVTFLRFCLLFLIVGLLYGAPPAWRLVNAPLVVVVIALDALDGYLARRRGETSVFGSVFDIAVDRAVENVLWIVLADVGRVPIWAPVVFVTRGAFVDSIRSHAVADGETPFGMMRGGLARFLVGGRFLRAFYGTLKALTFGLLLFLEPIPELLPDVWNRWSASLETLTWSLVLVTVILCVVRGLPVLWEFIQREAAPRRPESRPRRRGTA
jgi:CDP-diacylglycerol--glycerol-3-phosphate 3-phosphatidyltransferase